MILQESQVRDLIILVGSKARVATSFNLIKELNLLDLNNFAILLHIPDTEVQVTSSKNEHLSIITDASSCNLFP